MLKAVMARTEFTNKATEAAIAQTFIPGIDSKRSMRLAL
jgi:hypothetical protein